MADRIIAHPRSATPRITTIYGLSDPRTGYVRYVGKTTGSILRRLSVHLCSKDRTHRTNWIKSLKAIGLAPEIFSIEEVQPFGDWVESEQHWIAVFRSLGCDLTNLTAGGEGQSGISPSAETRARLSASQKGKKYSQEMRAKLSAANIGKS